MNKGVLWAIILIIILIGGWYWYRSTQSESAMTSSMGTYAYACDNGSQFTMTPSDDVSQLTLEAGSQGMFTGSVTVHKMGDGNRFETTSGQLVVFSGAGEEVQLAVGEESTVCNPMPNAETAPWNWGDAAEGGGIQPEVSLVVSESIRGKWQSTQDPKSVREFTADTMIDYYDGEMVSTSLYVAFTKENAPKMVTFPIEDNVAYIQATEKGTAQDTLNFKVVKLTPEELELIYMDRGGALTYKLVK